MITGATHGSFVECQTFRYWILIYRWTSLVTTTRRQLDPRGYYAEYSNVVHAADVSGRGDTRPTLVRRPVRPYSESGIRRG